MKKNSLITILVIFSLMLSWNVLAIETNFDNYNDGELFYQDGWSGSNTGAYSVGSAYGRTGKGVMGSSTLTGRQVYKEKIQSLPYIQTFYVYPVDVVSYTNIRGIDEIGHTIWALITASYDTPTSLTWSAAGCAYGYIEKNKWSRFDIEVVESKGYRVRKDNGDWSTFCNAGIAYLPIKSTIITTNKATVYYDDFSESESIYSAGLFSLPEGAVANILVYLGSFFESCGPMIWVVIGLSLAMTIIVFVVGLFEKRKRK